MADFYRRWTRTNHFKPHAHMRHLKSLVLGPPGSGKSTQAQRISETFDIPLVSAGSLLRTSEDVATDYGAIREYLERGDLVPDSIVNRLIKSRVGHLVQFVLEGYPRNTSQAEFLDDVTDFDRIISIRLSEKTIKTRLTGRRVCKDCEKVHHVEFDPPKQDGICDRCDGELIRREDDSPSAVRHRLEVFRDRTQPAIDYYSGQASFVNIDGEGDPDEVWNRVQATIKHIPEQTSVSL